MNDHENYREAEYSTMTDTSVVVDGVRIALADHGPGEPVVFLHGTPSHSFLWRNVAPQVRQAGYRTIVYDLLGYGRSERPANRDTSVAAQAQLLGHLLDHLLLDRVTLIAHDVGGAVAQIFSTTHPHRINKVMLIDTVSYDSWPSATWQRVIRDNEDERYVHDATAFDNMLSRQLRMTVSRAETMEGDTLEAYLAPHRSPLGRASFFEHQVKHYDSRYTMEITQRLQRLNMPVRIVWGAEDEWQPVEYARRLARDIPTATLHTVSGAGHFLPEDMPDAIVEHGLRLLAE